jgi:uncharacterized membrane protein
MPEFRMSTTIDRPVAAVYAYVADFARWPEWRLALSSAERLTTGPTAVGTRVAVTGQMMGRSLDMTVEVTAAVTNERLAFSLSGGPISGSGEFRFEPSGAGTRLGVVASVEPGGVLKIAGPLAARQAEQMWSNDLAALKGILEG